MVVHLQEIVTKYEERVRSMQNVPSLVTDFLLFFPFSTYHDFSRCSVNIFRLEIGASFFVLIPCTTNQHTMIFYLVV